MFKTIGKLLTGLFMVAAIFACGGGGGGSGRAGGSSSADFECDGSCTNFNLTVEDVNAVLARGVTASQALGVNATFAVVDRVGNVLAVYTMNGARGDAVINGQIGAAGGLEGATVPAVLAAISKAGTGAFLSSQGNAFSTRTASQIIQENFNPGEFNQPGGPLFGVQFSQLPCSDTFAGSAGMKPLPLGLSADPGGLPLYKNGDMVGGVGVEFDGLYTLDRNIADFDDDPEERIAMGASLGFEAPSKRIAPNMNLGKSLRYTDLSYDDITPAGEADLAVAGSLTPVALFFSGDVRAGETFGDPSSGVAETVRAGQPAAILVGPGGGNRFPPRSGTPLGGDELQAAEVNALLDSAITTAFRTRAAIRRPLDSGARVSIWVTDHLGNPLGFTRTQDAPIFGIDVALQKARTAAFFSSPDAGERLNAAIGEDVAGRTQSFIGRNILNGSVAFGNRSIGNLSRPFYTDGINGNPNGPFSLPFPGSPGAGSTWSPFNVGLQLNLVIGAVVQPLLTGTVPSTCTSPALGRRLANGMQIFPGSVALYRGNKLIGAIGVSGDGVDQDDLISFYSASRRGLDFVGHTNVGDAHYGFNAPIEIRADNIMPAAVGGTRLRYVNCPEAPFVADNGQNVCDGL